MWPQINGKGLLRYFSFILIVFLLFFGVLGTEAREIMPKLRPFFQKLTPVS